LADPEGNEFCVLEPREVYQHTGAVAAIVVESADPAALATFWSAAIGWPIVDRGDRFASLRSTTGRGPYLEFLPSVEPKRGKNRIHLDVAPQPADDHLSEVERLLALGARRVDIGQGDVSWIVLADPQGNEFCVLQPRTT
ncbi:MAG: VOC family protein, partial [Jiangellaceae bacterium]